MNSDNGRPSKAKQLAIETKLRTYFDRGVTASYAAKDAEYNIKTVCKYFDKWSNDIRECDENDFLSRQKEQRERIILGFDDLIFREYGILDNIENEIKKFEGKKIPIPKYFISSFQDGIKSISSLIEKKGLFTIQPLPDEVIEQKIAEKMKRYEIR